MSFTKGEKKRHVVKREIVVLREEAVLIEGVVKKSFVSRENLLRGVKRKRHGCNGLGRFIIDSVFLN